MCARQTRDQKHLVTRLVGGWETSPHPPTAHGLLRARLVGRDVSRHTTIVRGPTTLAIV